MNNLIRKRKTKKLNCPHCGQIFQRAQGLGGHIRYKHASVVSKAAQPDPKNRGAVAGLEPGVTPSRRPESMSESKSVPASVAVPTPQSVPDIGAHEHLKTALEALTQRQKEIDEELARMEMSQSEKQMIRKQLDAVRVALQAFGS